MSAKKIVVLHRGWVVMGEVSQPQGEGTEIEIREAAVIRRWGTTNGLGEIALSGPTADTVLDPCGIVRVHPLAVVMMIDCAGAAAAETVAQ